MPLVKSLHSPVFPKLIYTNKDKLAKSINDIITAITFDILRESPQLVTDVAAGKAEPILLETAVVRNIDKNKYILGISRDEIIQKVFDYMFGYGMLQPLIDDEDISDIIGTRYNEWMIIKNGKKMHLPDFYFGREEDFEKFCKLLILRNGGIINENDSHCRVSDEKNRLRINVSIKPRNVQGTSLIIRKHRQHAYTFDELIYIGMLNKSIADFFKICAYERKTVIFCGKGGSGKTTLMRTFINNIPPDDVVLIAESDVELYPDKPFCICQKTKKGNEGGRPLTLWNIVTDGLTMKLDWYVVGELVGHETWEFIKAVNTGHSGLASTHANSCADALSRLVTLSMSSSIQESERTVKDFISKGINYVVFMKDFKVHEIIEVKKFNSMDDMFVYDKIFNV
ncbi:MAG: ATPase, T2SS/T4P/T4SS family [Thermoplasmata archaeon]